MKKFAAAVLVAAFVIPVGVAMAGIGTVEKVEGDKVTLACENTSMKAGDKAEVKAEAKDAVASMCTIDKVEDGKVELTCDKPAVQVGEKVAFRRIKEKKD